MRSGWKSQARRVLTPVVLVAAVLMPAWPGSRVASQAPAAGSGVKADPAILGTISFRHLSVFSRGGRVTAVAGVPSNQQLYYMGSTGGGVWRTTDAGTTWTNISDGFFEAASIGALAVAESDPNVIYAGTGSACPRGNISPGIGMYKSTDAGKTWQHIGLREAGMIGRIQVHPFNPNLVYVAVVGNLFKPTKERGVYRSRDGGKTWELVYAVSERTGAVDVTMDRRNPDVLIAGLWTVERKPWTIESGSAEGGLVKTTDGGNTWQRLRTGLPAGRIGKVGVSISGASSQRVYAQIEADNDQGGTFRSDDGGASWTRTFAGRALQQRAWYYTHIHADPVDVDTVYALNVGAFKSTDGGKTFTGNAVQSHSDHHDMWINPLNNKAIVEGNDGGGTVTVNGSPWTPQNNNQPTSEIYRLAVDTRWPYWVYGGQQDNTTIAVPSVGNDTPYPVGGGESGHVAVDPRDYNIVYAGNYGGTMSRIDRKFNISENIRVYADSQTGQRAADMKYRSQWNAPIRISPHNPDVVYTTSQVVHRTTNAGLDWTVVSPDLTRNDRTKQQYSGGEGITRDNTGVEVYSTIFVLEESRRQPGLLWAGSDDGLVHVSRDNGKNWLNVTPKDWPEGCINSIDPSPHDPARATIAMYRYRQADQTPYIYQTNDYGKTWRRLADGKNGIPSWHFARVVREDTVRKGLLFAGTEFGLYASFDDGGNWQSFQLNLPITPVTDMMIYRDDLVLTTQGRGFYILENMAVPRAFASASATPQAAAMLFKPEDAYRTGGQFPVPTFSYWFREAPTAPVTVDVSDAQKATLFTITVPAGSPLGTAPAGAGGGRGGRGAGAGGGGDAAAGGRAAAAGGDAGAARAGGAGARAGGGGAAMVAPAIEVPEGGGQRGRGGFPAGPGGTASAVQGLNRATWTNLRLPSPYTVPGPVVMWGAGAGPLQGPRVPPGTYTVKVSSGSWSESQTFRVMTDPRYPQVTEAEGAEQLRLAREVSGQIASLYDQLGKLRDAKKQAAELTAKAETGSTMAAAARTLTTRIEAVEGEMTQMRGEGGQDSLNFPGRLDNQLLVLYNNIVGPDRRLGSPVTERQRDLRPETEQLLKRAAEVLKTDIAAFNAAAAKAGLKGIVSK